MTTKLTLSINGDAVQKAKRISSFRGTSVSKLFEDYINSIPEKEPNKKSSIREISNRLKENITIPENINCKDFIRDNRYQDYLKKEHYAK